MKLLAELNLAGQDGWVNVTDDLRSENSPVSITRGKTDARSDASPAQCTFELDNRSGRYSPQNPASPLYGKFGRNTPARISLGRGAFGAVFTDGSAGTVQTPDSVGTSITGDIDVRADLEVLAGSSRTWTSANLWSIAGKSDLSGTSWVLSINNGAIDFKWSPTGVSSITAGSAVLGVPATGRLAVRATLDVDNGAAGRTVTFYTAPTLAGPWVQLGSPSTTAGVTSIFDSTSPTKVGGLDTLRAAKCTVYGLEVRAGINGTVVASPNFAGQPLDPTPFASSDFTDAQGNVWTMAGPQDDPRIWYGDVDVRGVGECAAIPPRNSLGNHDAWVTVTAAGLLRRLGQGTDPAPSGLRDFVLANPTTVASYFPLSGAEGTQYSINLGRIGTRSLRFFPEGAPIFKYGVDLGAEWLGTGLEVTGTGNSFLRADVADPDDNFAIDFVFQSKAMGVLTVRVFDNTGNFWQLQLQNAANTGTLQVSYFDNETGTGLTSMLAVGPVPALVNNNAMHTCRFHVKTVSLGVQQYFVHLDGNPDPIDFGSSGITPRIYSGTAFYRLLYGLNAGQDVVNLGHLTLWSNINPDAIPTFDLYDRAARGYAGETAHARMTRVAAGSSIPLTIIGAAADTTVMGPQHAESALAQLRDAEGTDLGLLTDSRTVLGLQYRTRTSLYNQAPKLTIDYAGKQLAPPLEPILDDQTTRNHITVSRRDGDAREAFKATGPLSILDPPAGVGRYRDSVTVNTLTDEQLAGIANWLLGIGTIPDPRYPAVAVDLAAAEAAPLAAAAASVDVGDLIVITNMQALKIFDPVRLLVIQVQETIVNRTGIPVQQFLYTCIPAAPYDVAVYSTDRYDSDGSGLVPSLNTTATSFQVEQSYPAAPLWTTDVAAFPFDVVVAGERMTVTNITGATSPQTFTVTRSVNGVVKTHFPGEPVRLFKTPRYAL